MEEQFLKMAFLAGIFVFIVGLLDRSFEGTERRGTLICAFGIALIAIASHASA